MRTLSSEVLSSFVTTVVSLLVLRTLRWMRSPASPLSLGGSHSAELTLTVKRAVTISSPTAYSSGAGYVRGANPPANPSTPITPSSVASHVSQRRAARVRRKETTPDTVMPGQFA